ncbi:MAG: hypothetical protein M1817_003772 [Caeruleum heppii]|nr:MAG: hypothetical protein M1817_003772 [Caeruleum heppii]
MRTSHVARFTSLPTELKVLIMCHLPTADAIFALIRTSRAIYQTYLASSQTIRNRILENMIPIDVLPHAVVAHQMSQLKISRVKEVTELLQPYSLTRGRDTAAPMRIKWSLKELLALENTQTRVEAWTAGLCASAMAHHRFSRAEYKGVALPSLAEQCRIQRAFYRVKIFLSLGPRDSVPGFILQLEYGRLFFGSMPALELEQMACAVDFLTDRISDAVDKAAKIPSAPQADATYLNLPMRDTVLFKKLLFALNVGDQHAQLLSALAGPMRHYARGLRTAFQDASLGKGIKSNNDDDEIPDPTRKKKLLDDPKHDVGPRDAWYQSHGLGSTGTYHYRNATSITCRSWGYCFWDRPRLEQLGLFR